jgi:3-oxoacyl-[acyl-carrier protein] reductase
MDNVLVTGASRGIGLGIAKRLAASGYRVIAVARRESAELAAAAADAERSAAGAMRFEAFDLGEIGAISGFVAALRKRHGPLYGLVNNAAIGTEGLLANMPNAEIEALLRLNALSPIVLTKYAVRGMMAEGRGRIVNLASIVASTGYNALSVYAATKASMVGFTKSLAREVGRVGVTVNAIAPGFVDTAMTERLAADQRRRIMERSALRRLAEVEDIANMAAFLIGEAGRNITGAVMTIDAGNTA